MLPIPPSEIAGPGGLFGKKSYTGDSGGDGSFSSGGGKSIFFLLSKMPAGFPSFLILFPFLLGYILLVNFLLKRIQNKGNLALKTFLPLGLAIFLFSSACFGLSFLTQAKNNLSSNGSLCEISGRRPWPNGNIIWHLYQKDGEFRLPLGSRICC